MRFWSARRAGVLVALLTVAALVPAAARSHIPPESDGSTYTWTGAGTMNVDVRPWGGGYVRSTPYLIDCPMACVRPWDQGRDITLTAYPTPGHKFESWEGVCAGQGNPCTIKATGGLMDVRAVFSGQFVPPAAPSAVSPTLTADTVSGECPECLLTTFTGSGFNPNSGVSLHFEYTSPSGYSQDFPNARTTDGSGSWSAVFIENCLFEGFPDDTFHGTVVTDVTATDAQGASATVQISGTCP